MSKTTRVSTLEFSSAKNSFSAAHFTVFTDTYRERLHGHNYRLIVEITAALGENGITFDYVIYNQRLRALCQQLDSYFLLPTQCPYLRIEESGEYYYVYFHDEKIPFLKKDVKLLPLTNTSLEEMSQWFLDNLTADQQELDDLRIRKLNVKLSNGPSQAGYAYWEG